MCGIVGYVGNKQIVPLLIEGLRKLEYRGYDSAGIAVVDSHNNLTTRRAEGKLRNLEEVVRLNPLDGTFGIGHTRWATHGRPTEENAHPHTDQTGRIVVVHNGIIENYIPLKNRLKSLGSEFKTETDTEVVAHLIGHYKYSENLNLEEAVRKAVRDLKGIFALSIICADEPDTIVAVREGAPVVIGLGNGEYFVASDIPPILEHTRDVFYLGEREIAVLTKDAVRVTDFDGNIARPKQQRITWDPIAAEKGGFRHFMLKEIFEQPRTVRDTVSGRISLDTGKVFLDPMNISDEDLAGFASIKIAACGTSRNAGIIGKYMIEKLACVPVEVDYASEFRYREPLSESNTLLIVISQSGETADTVAAMREGRARGCKTLAICNVQGSMVHREADGTILTHAGPEIGVASTKAFTAQVVALYLLALHIGAVRGTVSEEFAKECARELAELPLKIESILSDTEEIEDLAKILFQAQDFLYLGRGINYPIALEGALKLKEISYIHAEGYPAGEMKHGPNALIDESLPVVFINTKSEGDKSSELRYEKTHSNIVEVKARDGQVISILNEGDDMSSTVSDHVLTIPHSSDLLSPILSVVPLQLLAYHIAVRKGCDVDQPRNLAKSVTVE